MSIEQRDPATAARIANLERLLGIQGAGNALFTVRDSTGLQRIRIGALPNGDYGIFLADTLGNQQELLPVVTAFCTGSFSTSSNAYNGQDTAPSPTITLDLGASGNFLATLSANIATSVNADVGSAGLTVDGSYINGSDCNISAGGSGTVSVSCAGTFNYLLAGPTGKPLTPGSHQFSIAYKSLNSHSVTFNNMCLTIIPV